MAKGSDAVEQLGYPRDARCLILNGDDFGLCHAENEGTVRFITDGIGTSCTLMMPCPWALHAAELLRRHPEIPVGVHLTVVDEYAWYRWRPVAPAHRVPSLVDADGCFMHPLDQERLLARFDRAEMEIEFRAQIEAALSCGLHPTHIDSHWHYHELREDIFDLAVGLAREYGLAIRTGHRKSSVTAVRALGLPCPDTVVDSGRLVDATGRRRDSSFSNSYANMLRRLPPGLTEWAIHVGTGTPELRALMPAPGEPGAEAGRDDLMGTWHGRQADLDFFTSDEARAIVAEEGIVLLSFAPLQALWRS